MECENAPNSNKCSSIIVFGLFHNFIILVVGAAAASGVVVFLALLFALQFFGLYFNFHIILGWKWQPLSLLLSSLLLQPSSSPSTSLFCLKFTKVSHPSISHDDLTTPHFLRPLYTCVCFSTLMFTFVNVHCQMIPRIFYVYGCTLDMQFTYKYSFYFFFFQMCTLVKRVKTNLPYCFVWTRKHTVK